MAQLANDDLKEPTKSHWLRGGHFRRRSAQVGDMCCRWLALGQSFLHGSNERISAFPTLCIVEVVKVYGPEHGTSQTFLHNVCSLEEHGINEHCIEACHLAIPSLILTSCMAM